MINELHDVKSRCFLTKDELIKICRWKSPRAIHLIELNSESKIKRITEKILTSKFEKDIINQLRKLKGVSLPMASAILMLIDPQNYGVIDIRVWQLLYEIGTVTTNPKGTNLNFNQWYKYLMIIRYFAEKYKVKARDIERTLFKVHKLFQEGLLYG